MSAPALSATAQSQLQAMLADRRERLNGILHDSAAIDVARLLKEVDSALNRLEHGGYGLCCVCCEPFTEAELIDNPLSSYCLCHLSPERQRDLESDLALAWQVQAALLPDPELEFRGWQTHYRYIPLGAVSGDYCDLSARNGEGGFFFVLGDVSGKGIAASLLMSHMHGALRTLIPSGCTLGDLLGRMNELLLASTLSSHFVTLVCGCVDEMGVLELVNAGHCQPVLVQRDEVKLLDSTHPPLGVLPMAGGSAPVNGHRVRMSDGDILFLYSDGLTEAADARDREYGVERLGELVRCHGKEPPRTLIARCLEDLEKFLNGASRQDDLTLLAIRRGSF